MCEGKLEQRAYTVELETREEGENGVIIGQPIVFNSVTDLGYFDEVIESGALDGTDLTDVRLCLNHDTSYVYARSRRNNENSTMMLEPIPTGLKIRARLNLEGSPKAQDLYSAITRGDMDKMSFMFSVEDEEWDNLESDHPTRRIKKIGTVVEVSAVTFPAYEATDIYARSKDALDSARSAVETVRQQKAAELESTAHEIEVLKLKTKMLGGN